MNDWLLVLAYLGALGGPALVVALVAVECQREIVKGFHRWRVRRIRRAFQREYGALMQP